MRETPLAGTTILVVEDEYLIALEAQRIVEEAGAEHVLLANSVADVRKLLEDGPQIDVAVLDLQLGKEDATPLIAAFSDSGISLLVTTGFGDGAPGHVPCLSKPYRDRELIESILRLIRR
jgi:CheY-like chemotaxis protein